MSQVHFEQAQNHLVMEIPKGHKMGWITYASFMDKTIISQGFDFEKVYKEALDKGIKHPIIISVPIKIKEG